MKRRVSKRVFWQPWQHGAQSSLSELWGVQLGPACSCHSFPNLSCVQAASQPVALAHAREEGWSCRLLCLMLSPPADAGCPAGPHWPGPLSELRSGPPALNPSGFLRFTGIKPTLSSSETAWPTPNFLFFHNYKCFPPNKSLILISTLGNFPDNPNG